jgi:5-(carboxyamino)imidazole ribonucleotide mutase
MKKKKTLRVPRVAIIMGSDSDLTVMKESAEILETLGVPFELTIVSAHRTPRRLFEYVSRAEKRGIQAVIAGAGGAAHLPGMTAALTPLPVIGVPVKSRISVEGIDSLLSIVQMPPGIPVATVAINGARNAGILAAQILAAADPALMKKIKKMKSELEKTVFKKIKTLEHVGYRDYFRRQGEKGA